MLFLSNGCKKIKITNAIYFHENNMFSRWDF
jgi:hypothetical protein